MDIIIKEFSNGSCVSKGQVFNSIPKARKELVKLYNTKISFTVYSACRDEEAFFLGKKHE